MPFFDPEAPSLPSEIIEAAREAIGDAEQPQAAILVFQYEEQPELGFGVELAIEGVTILTLEPGTHADGPVHDADVALAFGEAIKTTLAKALKQ